MQGGRRAQAGFTLIELMTVVALAAILVSLAMPSFRDLLARKRVEGLATGLQGDLQYARSEAVQRNTDVFITFGTNCYVIHTAAAVSCTAGSKSVSPASAEIKTVQVGESGFALAASAPMTSLQFDPVRAMATAASGASPYAAEVSSTVRGIRLRVVVSSVGRVQLCVPSGVVAGYPSC